MTTRRALFLLVTLAAAVALSSCGRNARTVKRSASYEPWRIVSYDPTGGYGTYLGNGSIGVRLHAEGTGSHAGQPLQCLMAGLYKGESLAPLPNFSDLPIYLGRKASAQNRFILDAEAPYEQVLDMRSGSLHTKCTLKKERRSIDADITFVVSRRQDRIDIFLSLLPRFTDDITVTSGFDKASSGLDIVDTRDMGHSGRSITCRIPGQVEQVSLAAACFGDVDKGSSVVSSNKLGRDITLAVSKRHPLFIHKTVIISRGAETAAVPTDAAKSKNASALLNRNSEDWNTLWKSRIEIEGDPEAQQAVNSCMFYLLQSVREGTDYSIAPMGLSSDSWTGHIFWDADTWMFPALLPLHPELAKSITEYRYKTLSGAKQNARNRHLNGAEYAWESARTGVETIGMPFKEERHITSDVALAQWQYFQATQDKKWLAERGYPVIKECADYWVSRVKYNSVKDRYEILNVVGPDEDAEIVSNNAYTNASTKKVLEAAASAAEWLGKPSSPQWSVVARKMYIPYDKTAGRYIEYDGFNRSSTKQADTELLIYPLETPMNDTARSNTFDYWTRKVNPRGPAMSSSVHAVIAAQLGRPDEAYRYFTDSYKPFFRPPFNYFNEKRSQTYQNMYFMTGAAGPLQAVMYGFCGLRYTQDGQISVKPNLPTRWKSVTLHNVYASGKRFDIIIRRGAPPRITRTAP